MPATKTSGWTSAGHELPWLALLQAFLLAGVLLAMPRIAGAQRVEGDRAAAEGIYQAEVQVRSQAADERDRGFARALSQVLTKLSGDRRVAERPGIAGELRRAGDKVDSYDYRQDEGRSPTTGAPIYTTTLIVRFDPDRIDDIAAALAVPVWPQPRPKPVLWLAIDDGSGPRLVDVGSAEAARSALDRAQDRGFRLGLPGGRAAEQAAVGAIWRGDVAAISSISARYSPQMQLVGKLYRDDDGWTADWIMVDNGRELSSWSSHDRSALRAMAGGADGAADALSARYAKAEPIGEPGRHEVMFSGIDSSEDYMRLVAWLRAQSVVRDVRPLRATGDRLDVELDLATGLAGLRRVLDDELLVEETVLAQAPAGEGAGQAVAFRLR